MPVNCSSWDASGILKIDPDTPGFTCVGYAPSKGRRCHNPIAAANRQEASKLLAKLSKLDPSSSRIGSILESLAPRLLCKRYHQNQADSISEKWNDRLERFTDAETVREEACQRREKREARERRIERAEEAEAAREEARHRRKREEKRERRIERGEEAEAARGEDRERREAREAHERSNTRTEVPESIRSSAGNATNTLTTLSNTIEASRTMLANNNAQSWISERPTALSGARHPVAEAGAECPTDNVTALLAEAEALVEQGRQTLSRQTQRQVVEQPSGSPILAPIWQEATVPEAEREDHVPSISQVSENADECPATPLTQQPPLVEEEAAEEAQVENEHTHGIHDNGEHGNTGGECSICCEDLRNGESLLRCRTQCGQTFHKECIETWLGTDEHTKTCPYW